MKSITRLGTKPLRTAIILLSVVALAIPFVVFADSVVVNDVETGADATKNPGESGTAQAWLVVDDNQTDSVPGCNASGSAPVTISFSADSAETSFSPVSGQVTDCETDHTVQTTYTVSADAIPGTTVTVTANASGGRSHQGNPGEFTAGSFQITIPESTVTSTNLSVEAASGTFGETTTLSATLSADGSGVEGKSISFTLNGNPISGTATTGSSGVATLPDVSLAGINAGFYSTGVGASFAGDSTHDDSSGTASLDIAKADQTIDFGALADKNFGDPDFTVSATASSGLPVSFSTVSSLNVCSVDGDTVTIEGAGECTIRASQGGDVNYNAAPNVDQTFTVNKASATISLSNLNHTYDSDPKAATATTDPDGLSGVTITYDGSGTPPTEVGSYAVVASLDNPNYQAPDATDTLEISPASATISLSDLEHTYDGTARSATATTDPAGLETVTVTYDGSTDLPVNAGSYVVEATLDNPNYTADPAEDTLVINKANQTIDFAAIADKTYGDDAFDPAATASSGLPVSYTADGDCSIVGGMVQIDGAGSCEVTASQAGDDNYSAAPDVSHSFTIHQRAIQVTADAKSKVYGDADPDLTHFISDGSLAAGDEFSGALSRESGENVGTYAIEQGTLALSDNYDLTFVEGTLTITPRPITIKASDVTRTYGETTPAFSIAVHSGTFGYDDDLSNLGTPSFDTDPIPAVNVGSYRIEVSGLSNANYDISYATGDDRGELTIVQRPITVTADPQTKVYGDDDPALTFQVTSGNLVAGDSFSGALSRDAGEDVGTYAINQGSLTAGPNYDLTYVGADLTITKRPIEVTADDKSKVYGEADPDLTYEITDGSLAFSDAFTGSLTRESGEDVGTYAIQQGSLALSDNYDLTFVDATLTITQRAIEVTANDQFKLLGDDDPVLDYEITVGELVFGDEFTGAITRDPGEDVGTYQITKGSLELSSNYNLTFVEGTLTIGYNVCVDFNDDKSKKAGSTVPVRIALCDVHGNNVSSSDITVHAYQRVKVSNGASAEVDPEDAGNANPDDDFRFAGGRYIYNLSTKGMSQGTWHLKFEVDGVQHPHYFVEIQIKK